MNKLVWATLLLWVPHTVMAQQQEERRIERKKQEIVPSQPQPPHRDRQQDVRSPATRPSPDRPPIQQVPRAWSPQQNLWPLLQQEMSPRYSNRMCQNERVVFITVPQPRNTKKFQNLTPKQREQIKMAREDFRREVQRILRKS